MKIDICPECEAEELEDRWVVDRKLQQRCFKCSWVGPIREPEPKDIKTIKDISVSMFGGHCFTIYDKYGYIITISQNYSTKDESVKELKKNIESWNKNEKIGPCTGLIWPSVVTVEAEVYK